MAVGETGTVTALYLRPTRSEPPRAASKASAVAGVGLHGDIHADPLSPRQVLVVTADAYARLALAPNTLRENILLDVDPAVLKPGRLLAVGPETVLWLSFHCEACGSLDARQPGLSKAIGAQRGVLARVWRGGGIATGDAVSVLAGSLDLWSDDWRERIATILERMPQGMVIEYRQLARLAGVQSSYCRVFPRIARDLGVAGRAVAMTSSSPLPRWEGYELFAADAPLA